MYLFDTTEKLIAEGAVERIGLPGGWLWLKDGRGKRLVDNHADFPDHKAAVKAMFTTVIDETTSSRHQMVSDTGWLYGGPKHTDP